VQGGLCRYSRLVIHKAGALLLYPIRDLAYFNRTDRIRKPGMLVLGFKWLRKAVIIRQLRPVRSPGRSPIRIQLTLPPSKQTPVQCSTIRFRSLCSCDCICSVGKALRSYLSPTTLHQMRDDRAILLDNIHQQWLFAC
jgi:hypothetical protein